MPMSIGAYHDQWTPCFLVSPRSQPDDPNPREFELAGTEAIIRKEGARLIIEPVASRTRLLALLAGWERLDEAFPEILDPHPASEDVA